MWLTVVPDEVKVDPTRCPTCLAENSMQELARRPTRQPVTLRSGDHGLEVDDYGEWDYGDDVDVTGVACRECDDEWSSLGDLDEAMRVHALLVWVAEQASLARTALDDPAGLPHADSEHLQGVPDSVYAIDRLDAVIAAAADDHRVEGSP